MRPFTETPEQAEPRAPGPGGEVEGGEDSERAVQEHQERDRGREEAAGPHRGEAAEGGEHKAVLLCSSTHCNTCVPDSWCEKALKSNPVWNWSPVSVNIGIAKRDGYGCGAVQQARQVEQ